MSENHQNDLRDVTRSKLQSCENCSLLLGGQKGALEATLETNGTTLEANGSPLGDPGAPNGSPVSPKGLPWTRLFEVLSKSRIV